MCMLLLMIMIADDNIDPIHSIEIFEDYFWFDPWYKSAVSADATRVCVCDDNGEPHCMILL